MPTNKTRTKTNQNSTPNKAKLVAGAVGIAVVAGGTGYLVKDITGSTDSIYTVSNYELRKAKRNLNQLTVRATDEAPTSYNSNGNVPSDWSDTNNTGCKTRSDVLLNSLENTQNDSCNIQSGELFDYYTGKTISLKDGIDIDHIVAKKNAWDSGGYTWNKDTWTAYVNDEERVLIATSDSANRSKGSKDAADWLPENTDYWCKYVIQQIKIKNFYNLSVRQAEKDKIQEVLTNNCKTK